MTLTSKRAVLVSPGQPIELWNEAVSEPSPGGNTGSH